MTKPTLNIGLIGSGFMGQATPTLSAARACAVPESADGAAPSTASPTPTTNLRRKPPRFLRTERRPATGAR